MSIFQNYSASTRSFFLLITFLIIICTQALADPPYIPHHPYPAHQSQYVSRTSILEWLGGDPDGNSVTYDIYFGTSANPPLVLEDWTGNYFNPYVTLNSALDENTTYYWKILSEDTNGENVESMVFNFTTASWFNTGHFEVNDAIYEMSPGGLIQNVDFDLDGDLDIIIYSETGNDISLLENDGNMNYVNHEIEGNFYPGSKIVVCDFDNDSDNDFLTTHENIDYVAWWENEGNYEFTRHFIVEHFNGSNSVVASDFDNDGDLDAIATAYLDEEVAWFENAGNNEFIEHTVATDIEGPLEVFVADMDNDGDKDVVALTEYIAEVFIWENTGNDDFIEHNLQVSGFENSDMIIGDINQDGLNDLIINQRGRRSIECLFGIGNFGYHRKVLNCLMNNEIVVMVDLDCDGDNDIVSSLMSAGKIVWWEFKEGDEFTFHLIVEDFDHPYSIDVADINNDGINEVISTSSYQDGIYYWTALENNAPEIPEYVSPESGEVLETRIPRFEWTCEDSDNDEIRYLLKLSTQNPPDSFAVTDHVYNYWYPAVRLEAGATYYWEVLAVDVFDDTTEGEIWSFSVSDGNEPPYDITGIYPLHGSDNIGRSGNFEWLGGDPDFDDVVYDVFLGTTINPPLVQSGITGNYFNIISGTGQLLEADTQYFLKISSEDETGLVTEGDLWQFQTQPELNVIEWNWTRFTVDYPDITLKYPNTIDYDNDGDYDLVGLYYPTGSIYFLENIGNNVFEENMLIENSEARKIKAVMDFDSDNDIDILTIVTSLENDYYTDLILWKNDGNNNFTSNLIATEIAYNRGHLDICDMDDDGDFDIIQGEYYDLSIWINQGDDTFYKNIIVNRPMEINQVKHSDVDCDGDFDIVLGVYWPGLSWVENLGNMVFEENYIDPEFNLHRTYAIEAVDMDLDGDIDLVVGTEGQYILVWYENDGNQEFIRHILAENTIAFRKLIATDFDGDGDMDFFGTGGDNGYRRGTCFYENTGNQVYESYVIEDNYNAEEFLSTCDIDNDGILELVGSYNNDYGFAYWECGEIDGFDENLSSKLLPDKFEINNVYPNPFNSVLSAIIALPEKSKIQVTVFNIMGQEVASLSDGILNAGYHTVTFNGGDLASGVYFVKAIVPGKLNQIKKVVLMK